MLNTVYGTFLFLAWLHLKERTEKLKIATLTNDIWTTALNFLVALKIGVKTCRISLLPNLREMFYTTAEEELQERERAQAVTYERGENCKWDLLALWKGV